MTIKRCFTDNETNGLLDTLDRQHCAVIIDDQTNETFRFRPNEDAAYLAKLEEYDEIVLHNGIRFDLAVLKKLHNWEPKTTQNIVDTLVLARLCFPDIRDLDFTKVEFIGKTFGKTLGSHSLEAWGRRLGVLKGEYKDDYIAKVKAEGGEYEAGDEWENFCEEMLEYNVQDVVVTRELYNYLMATKPSPRAVKLEHDAALIMAKQERWGFTFDKEAAVALYATLSQRRNELQEACAKLFPEWVINKGEKVAKVNSKIHGYVKDVPFTVIEILSFNPSSRAHIADRLKVVYGWKPEKFTPSGTPQVDEVILSKLPYEPCKLLTEYLLVAKRVGQIAEGSQSWLHHYKKATGCIHGAVNPNGAVTGRATHSYPNVAQVPASRSPYGHECRSLFTAPKGWYLAGTDASGLELRCLAHYMAKWDGGAYGDLILKGDIHSANQKAAGLPTRDDAKTFIYAFLYGAGAGKIGSIIGKGSQAGGKLKARFLQGFPALAALTTAITETVADRGYLLGLDKRVMPVRHEHAALNTLLQGAGALICKSWLVELYKLLEREGYTAGEDFRYCAWVHDELQIACKTKDLADKMDDYSRQAMKIVEAEFNIRCPLDTDCKVGNNWAETH